jgi:hypothetical protein
VFEFIYEVAGTQRLRHEPNAFCYRQLDKKSVEGHILSVKIILKYEHCTESNFEITDETAQTVFELYLIYWPVLREPRTPPSVFNLFAVSKLFKKRRFVNKRVLVKGEHVLRETAGTDESQCRR